MNIRKLEKNDFFKGYLELLYNLSPNYTENGLTYNKFKKYLKNIEKYNQYHYVIDNISNSHSINDMISKYIIGIGSLHILHKFSHNLGKVGQIEDIIIHKDYRINGYGKMLVNYLITVAKEKGCYKVILNCKEENKGFYERLGFSNKNNYQMSLYFDKNDN